MKADCSDARHASGSGLLKEDYSDARHAFKSGLPAERGIALWCNAPPDVQRTHFVGNMK